MAVESGESCVLLESTDEASDLSDTSPSDSIQQVTESSSGVIKFWGPPRPHFTVKMGPPP